MRIFDLIEKIKDEEYVLPDFQRGFVWDKTKIKKLFISLYKNYPTGTLLIWKTKQNVVKRGKTPPREGVEVQFILDGQQRLTSVYTIFEGVEPPFYEGKPLKLDLYFNIETEEFSYWQPVKMRENFCWINLNEFYKTKEAGKFLENMINSDNENIKNFFKDNFAKFLNKLNRLSAIATYNYYIDDDKLNSEMDIMEVVKIFNLVNKEGRTLSESDLAMAHISMVVPGMKDKFRKKLSLLKEKGFEFDFNFLIGCLNAIVTGRGKFDNLYSKKNEEIDNAWVKTEKSIDYIINFLVEKAYINSSSKYELKTNYLLMPLVAYAAKNNNEFKDHADQKKALYWLYNAMIWGRYTRRGASSPLEQDIVSITKTNSISELINNLKREVRNFKVKSSDLEDLSINSPFFNITFIVAKSKNAIDWFNGTILKNNLFGSGYKLHMHHIFPKEFLRKNGLYETREQQNKANSLLNRAFLTAKANIETKSKNPEKYLLKVIKKYPEALKNQFVPSKEIYWRIESFEDFLKERAKIIANELNKFLEMLVDSNEYQISYKDMIRAGENQNQEFKSTFSYDIVNKQQDPGLRFNIVKTISGFLNSDGGTLFVGVKDDGRIYGLESDYQFCFRNKNADGFELEFRSCLEKYFKEVIIRRYIEYKFIQIDNRDVLVINVERSNQRVFIKKDNIKILYVRKGNKTDPMTDPEEIDEYIQEHWAEEES